MVKQDLVSRLKAKALDHHDIDGGSDAHGALQEGHTDLGTDCTADDTKMVAAQVQSQAAETENVVDKMKGCEPQQQGTVKGSHVHHPNSAASDTRDSQKLYITMNLPAMALEFLDAFCGLLSDFPKELQSDSSSLGALPTVLCYCFSKSEDAEADVRGRAEIIMGRKLPSDSKVRTVRNVAPNKEMMCVVFQLSPEVLFAWDCSSSTISGCAGEQTEGMYIFLLSFSVFFFVQCVFVCVCCLLYTSPSPRDMTISRMPSSA